MDVKEATKQKIAAIKDEFLALIRKEKSFDECKEDLRAFLGKQSTRDALERIAVFIPPAYNIAQVAQLLRSDEPAGKKAFLTFENVGAYSIAGAVWAWAPPELAIPIGIATVYAIFAPMEWILIENKNARYAEELKLHGAQTVGYIRMEDKGERSLLGGKKPTKVYSSLDDPKGKAGIVGYRKLVDGEVVDYIPKIISDPDTNTKGESNMKNWEKNSMSKEQRKFGYYLTQAQVYAYTAITYTLAYMANVRWIIPGLVHSISQYL